MKYRFKCQNDNAFFDVESLIIRPVCPNHAWHTIIPSSVTIIYDDDRLDACVKDYKVQRKELIDFVIANSETMSNEELAIAAQHFCLPAETRNLFYTIEEQIEFGKIFHRRSCHSRNMRYNAGVAELFNRLSYAETYTIIQDLTPGNLVWNYINLGVEGTTEGDDVGIFDYFQNTGSFSSTGFLSKSWSPVEMTMEQLGERVMDILKNGNY